MTKLKLERYGVQELSSEELKNVEGGLVGTLLAFAIVWGLTVAFPFELY